MWASILFVLLFLALQILAAMQWDQELGAMQQSGEVVAIAKMALYVLIFLHGLHVVGGLVPLCMIATHTGFLKHQSLVPLLVVYWDFICAIWVLFFIVILLIR
jgi:heme/copper-type cytochrome/quinol oxidase subunit 3